MKKKLCSTILSLAMASALLAGCGSSSQGTEGETPAANTGTESETAGSEEMKDYSVTLMLAQSSYSEDAFKEIQTKFKELYNIDLEYEVIPDAQFVNLSQVRISTGEAPDVIFANIPSAYSTYDAKNTLVNLDDQAWTSRLSMDTSSIVAADGSLYGMPITGYSGVMGVIYNVDVFESLNIEIPKTYDDFLAACETIKQSGTNPLYLSFKDTWTTQIMPMIYFANALDERCNEVYAELNTNQLSFADVPEYKQALTDFQALLIQDM